MKRNMSVVCVCSAPNNLISGNIIKEMPVSVASGTHYIKVKSKVNVSHNRPRWPKGFQVG